MEKENTEDQVVAIVKDGEATDKKQISWSKFGDVAIANFPCGKQIYFDLKPLDSQTMKFYGSKQWLADQVSAIKDEKEKIAEMQSVYNEAVKCGLELSPTGKVGIIGKTRSNAASNAKAFENNMRAASKTVSLEGLMLKKAMSKFPGQEEFTEADEAKLQEFLAMVVESN